MADLAGAGYHVAIGDVLEPEPFEHHWRRRLHGLDWRLVVVLPSLEETLARSRARKKAAAQAALAAKPSDTRLAANCGTTCTPSITVPKNSTMSITDLVFQNPAGDSGTVSLLRDQDVLLTQQLDNFRDLDFHFITPLILTAGQQLVFSTVCDNKPVGTQPAAACTPAVLISSTGKKSPAKPQG